MVIILSVWCGGGGCGEIKPPSTVFTGTRVNKLSRYHPVFCLVLRQTLIETHNAAFISDLESLNDRICNTLLDRNKGAGKDESTDMETINAALGKLKTALEILDIGTINSTIDILQTYTLPESIASVAESISDNILIAEYDKALELAKDLLSMDK
jgi:hypothetical protein